MGRRVQMSVEGTAEGDLGAGRTTWLGTRESDSPHITHQSRFPLKVWVAMGTRAISGPSQLTSVVRVRADFLFSVV